jgi:hypothetical protein
MFHIFVPKVQLKYVFFFLMPAAACNTHKEYFSKFILCKVDHGDQLLNKSINKGIKSGGQSYSYSVTKLHN